MYVRVCVWVGVWVFWCMGVWVCGCVRVSVFGAVPKVGCSVYNVWTMQMHLPVIFKRGVVSLLTLPHPLDALFNFYLNKTEYLPSQALPLSLWSFQLYSDGPVVSVSLSSSLSSPRTLCL